MQLVCASYNIHRCIGRDGNRNPERIRHVLHEINAHIIALQEVELIHESPNLLNYLCSNSKWNIIVGKTMLNNEGHYGNVLLTKIPIISKNLIDLSVPNHEPRGAIHTILEYKDKKIQIIATHLGLWPSERRSQVLCLLDLLKSKNQNIAPSTSILIGDINEWFLWGRPLRWLNKYFQSSFKIATFPSQFPVLPLDRIWVKPKRRIISIKSWKSQLSQIASDHLPLVAHIEI